MKRRQGFVLAVISDGKCIAERTLDEPQAHSEQLLTLIDSVLTTGQNFRESIDAVAVSIGPGSFTGLRIGLSVAKGLCFAWEKPIIPVPTLNALAWNCLYHSFGKNDDYVLPMIDARRNEAYAALFRIHENKTIIEIQPAQAVSIETCASWISAYKHTVLLGDATEKFLHHIEHDEQKPTLELPQVSYSQPCAASVGLLGEQLFQEGTRADVSSLEPYYIKEFVTVAQPQLTVKQHGMV